MRKSLAKYPKLSARVRRSNSRPAVQIVLGTLADGLDGGICVEFAGNQRGPQPARTMVALGRAQLREIRDGGHQLVLLITAEGAPIVMGVLRPLSDLPEQGLILRGDSRRAELEAADELVLKCGEASLTLRKNGRVSLRGTHVESRSKGINRIKGGVVSIN